MKLNKTQVNVTQLAELVGMNRNLVARRLRDMELAGGNGENLKLYELGAALQALLTPSMKENGEMSPQDRKAWYMLAGQGEDTIEVAYLDGIETPYLEQQQGFTVDGVTFKVRIDAGVAPLDWRGLVKSEGA